MTIITTIYNILLSITQISVNVLMLLLLICILIGYMERKKQQRTEAKTTNQKTSVERDKIKDEVREEIKKELFGDNYQQTIPFLDNSWNKTIAVTDSRMREMVQQLTNDQELITERYNDAGFMYVPIHAIVPFTNPVYKSTIDITREHLLIHVPEDMDIQQKSFNVVELPLATYLVLKEDFLTKTKSGDIDMRHDHMMLVRVECGLSTFFPFEEGEANDTRENSTIANSRSVPSGSESGTVDTP